MPKELLRKKMGWLIDIGHNSWWHMKCAQHAVHNPKLKKDGIIETSLVVAIKRLKDPPTWLKVATTLEKPRTPTHPKPSGKVQIWVDITKKSYECPFFIVRCCKQLPLTGKTSKLIMLAASNNENSWHIFFFVISSHSGPHQHWSLPLRPHPCRTGRLPCSDILPGYR